ncbi:MAG TPA: sensor histidine kinase [Acidobacteriaceae bacterium]
MESSDSLQKQTANKLLPFRAPSGAMSGPDGALDLEQVPHDIGRLRRPSELEGGAHAGMQDGLAHDARNLMTSLEFFSTLLGEPGVLAEEHKHFANDLRMLNHVLGSLVERMVGALPADAAPVCVREPLRPRLPATPLRSDGQEWNDAGAMVKSCEQLLAAVAGPGVGLQVSFERGLGPLALRGEELTRVLINLVQNASDAMPGGGRVAISVRRCPGAEPCAVITVQDTGSGIPAHALGQIFQAGYTSKKEARKWPAVAHHGLGLTIVRELVEGAGGSVRVSSALKRGTTFEVKLPCRRP